MLPHGHLWQSIEHLHAFYEIWHSDRQLSQLPTQQFCCMPLKHSSTPPKEQSWTDGCNNNCTTQQRNMMTLLSDSLWYVKISGVYGYHIMLYYISTSFSKRSILLFLNQPSQNLGHSIVRATQTKLVSLVFDMQDSLLIMCKLIWWRSCQTGSEGISP